MRGVRATRGAAAMAVAVLAGGVLAACGGSGGEVQSEAATATAATTAAAATTTGDVPALAHRDIPSVVGVPVSVGADGAVALGSPVAPVVLDEYEDYLCEACGQFTRLYDQEVYSAITGHQVLVRYHPITLLDGKSPSKDYSTRATAAARCVAITGDAMAYSTFRDALFRDGVQPAEGGATDYSDAQLAQIAREAGADGAALACITAGAQQAAAAQAAEASRASLGALSGGQAVTPSVYHGADEAKISKSGWLADLLPAGTVAPSPAPTTGGR